MAMMPVEELLKYQKSRKSGDCCDTDFEAARNDPVKGVHVTAKQ